MVTEVIVKTWLGLKAFRLEILFCPGFYYEGFFLVREMTGVPLSKQDWTSLK